MSLTGIREQISILALQIEDPDLLVQIYHQLAAAYKAEKGSDFWEELTDRQQQDLLISIKQVKEGKVISDMALRKEAREWLTK